jgi:hypothetical protein
MFGNTFTAMSLKIILYQVMDKLSLVRVWNTPYLGRPVHPVLGKACTRLLLKFDLPHFMLRNQCSPSMAKHFLVDVKKKKAHLSMLCFLLMKA